MGTSSTQSKPLEYGLFFLNDYFQYLQDLKFPYGNEMTQDRIALSDWLFGAAIRFEYGDSGEFDQEMDLR